MRAMVVNEAGGDFVLEEREVPEPAFGQALITIKGHIRPANGVGTALRHNGGMIGYDPAQIVLLGEITEDSRYLGANIAVERRGKGQRDNSATDQLVQLAIIGNQQVFLNSEETFGGGFRGGHGQQIPGKSGDFSEE